MPNGHASSPPSAQPRAAHAIMPCMRCGIHLQSQALCFTVETSVPVMRRHRALQAFMACSPGWEMHGQLAKTAITCVAELLPLAPTPELHEGTPNLLKAAHAVCTAAMAGPPAGARWRGSQGHGHARIPHEGAPDLLKAVCCACAWRPYVRPSGRCGGGPCETGAAEGQNAADAVNGCGHSTTKSSVRRDAAQVHGCRLSLHVCLYAFMGGSVCSRGSICSRGPQSTHAGPTDICRGRGACTAVGVRSLQGWWDARAAFMRVCVFVSRSKGWQGLPMSCSAIWAVRPSSSRSARAAVLT